MRAICLSWLICSGLVVAAERPGPVVPEGFTVEVVANFPQLQRPIFAHFDDQGRLYVGESSGANLNRAQMLEQKPHWITCLEDTNDDGVFDKSTKFVDSITLPQGMLWYRGSVYCACPPSIWKFTDTDGDGKADQREEILTGFGFNGNACDTHGPFLSPTGRLYIAQGRHGHEFKDKEGKVYSKGKAGRIYSCRLDGSDVRVHCGGGFDNPIEIEFTEEGEMIGTVNILYPNRGDCLMHWVEGGVYPREDQQDCISEFKWTGGLLGPIVDMGHVALSGLMRYRGTHFGPQYADNYFVTEFNTHKVKRVELKRSGSTFTAEPHEFLTSADGDFHPTDVLEDADGSLLVVDTGAWFLNGCPTSRVSKPDVTGAIYRIRKTDGAKVEDPRGKKLRLADAAPAEWIRYLHDKRPAIREQAIELLATRKQGRLPLSELLAANSFNLQQRMNCYWATARRGEVMGPTEIMLLSFHESPSDSQIIAALKAFAVVPNDDRGSRDPCVPYLPWFVAETGSPAVVRNAAEVISFKYGRQGKVPAVLRNVATPSLELLKLHELDRMAEHAIIDAIIRLGTSNKIAPELSSKNPVIRRIALIALDQMDDSPLTAAMVTPLLATDDPTLQRTALEVLARHPGWGKEALGTIREWLQEPNLSPEKLGAIRTLLVAQANEDEVQKLIAESLNGREDASVGAMLWEVVQRADVVGWPAGWNGLLQQALTMGDPQHQLVALRIIQRRELADFDAAIVPIADDTVTAPLLRSEALTALGRRLPEVSEARFAFLLSQLDADRDTPLKLSAARAMAIVPLSDEQLCTLAGRFESAGPLIISTLLKAYERSKTDRVGAALVSGLRQGTVAEALSGDEVSALVRRYSGMVHQLALPLIKQLGIDPAAQEARLKELSPLITEGDAKAGERVFFGKKANCSACHAVAGKGARIGPDLSRIGQSRTGKDLLEAIVYPSASFVNGYRPSVAALHSGKVVQGIVAVETSDALTLRTADLQEVRVLRKEIDELKESSTSIMPKGLDTQLTPDELRHLLAYLQGRK